MLPGRSAFDDFNGGLKMTVRELMDINEARENMLEGLLSRYQTGKINEQLLNRLRGTFYETSSFGTIPVHSFIFKSMMPVHVCVLRNTRRVTPTDMLLTICELCWVMSRWN